MHTQIYVNLPVRSVARSRAFFESLGYAFDPKFSNDQGAALVLGENLYAMLLDTAFFRTFTDKRVVDATKEVEVLVCVSCADRATVDGLVARALAAGGSAPRAPQDHGWMYAHGFQDPDGHVWELVAYASEPA